MRNTTARAFAVVAHALTIPALLPFLKAVCQSKKSWQARHTGVKVVQQIAILSGVAVLPHLTKLVQIIESGLEDENQKVRMISALAIAALAEASTPYGIESFDSVLKPLWKGIRSHRGKNASGVFESHRVYHSFDGPNLRVVLYERSHGDFNQRVCYRGRRDEENYSQSGQTVRPNRRAPIANTSDGNHSSIFQKFLGEKNRVR